ncbi:MAG: hypothetical protein O7D91_21615 [Planctomycetota bacterium]|nr:hypothetical protein [Planctomycetota bacterium]
MLVLTAEHEKKQSFSLSFIKLLDEVEDLMHTFVFAPRVIVDGVNDPASTLTIRFPLCPPRRFDGGANPKALKHHGVAELPEGILGASRLRILQKVAPELSCDM